MTRTHRVFCGIPPGLRPSRSSHEELRLSLWHAGAPLGAQRATLAVGEVEEGSMIKSDLNQSPMSRAYGSNDEDVNDILLNICPV